MPQEVGKLELGKLLITSNNPFSSSGRIFPLENHYTRIDLYENLFENFVTGTIGIEDSVNLPTNFGILGHEEIHIIFKGNNPWGIVDCNTEPIDLKLLVHEITPRHHVSEKVQHYALNLISPTALLNNVTKVSQSYRGNIGGIVQKMGKDHLKEDIFTGLNAPGIIQCVIPYWNPVMTINWLAERAVHQTSTNRGGQFQYGLACDTIFYQDRDIFKLNSISNLIKASATLIDPSGTTLHYQPVDAAGGQPFRPTLQRSVSHYTIQSSFNTLKHATEGGYSGQLVTHDITRKKLVYHPPFRYTTDFFTRPHLAENHFLSIGGVVGNTTEQQPQQRIGQLTNQHQASYRFQSKNALLYDGHIHVNTPEHWTLRRMSHLSMMRNVIVVVEMPGDTAIRLGSVVRWKDFPSAQPTSDGGKQENDKFLEGDFLVTAIHHQLEAGKYHMIVELTKDALHSTTGY